MRLQSVPNITIVKNLLNLRHVGGNPLILPLMNSCGPGYCKGTTVRGGTQRPRLSQRPRLHQRPRLRQRQRRTLRRGKN
jgi:hypothetical protein